MMEEHFEKLEELIKDDDKIVTVASYALLANIPFEESQKVITKYVEVNKKSKEIFLTYVLNGIKKNSETLSIVQVSDETLDDEKRIYKDDPTVIIFSIQKAKLVDYNIISLVKSHSDSKEHILSGIIVGKNCVQRILQKKILPSLPATTIKGKSTMFTKQNSSLKPAAKSEEIAILDDKNESNQTKVKAQGSLGNMFNKATQSKKADTKQEKPKQNGGMLNFFKKQPCKDLKSTELGNKEVKKEKELDKEIKTNHDFKPKNLVRNKNDLDLKKENKKSDLFDSDTDDEILKDLDVNEVQPAVATAAKTEKNTKATKAAHNTKKISQKKKREKADIGNEKSAKKRKRIIVDEGSDSDDIFGSEKSDTEEVQEKFDVEPEPEKIETKPLLPKNKKRKAVKRTYEDEEGYIVTKTEYVYESASEDENEPDNKIIRTENKSKPKLEKKNSNNSDTEISPNKVPKGKKAKKAPSGNQPTLMNFFKKK